MTFRVFGSVDFSRHKMLGSGGETSANVPRMQQRITGVGLDRERWTFRRCARLGPNRSNKTPPDPTVCGTSAYRALESSTNALSAECSLALALRATQALESTSKVPRVLLQ